MAETNTTPEVSRGISKGEMELLTAFNGMILAREINKQVDIESLTLTYSVENGFVVQLVETPRVLD